VPEIWASYWTDEGRDGPHLCIERTKSAHSQWWERSKVLRFLPLANPTNVERPENEHRENQENQKVLEVVNGLGAVQPEHEEQ